MCCAGVRVSECVVCVVLVSESLSVLCVLCWCQTSLSGCVCCAGVRVSECV